MSIIDRHISWLFLKIFLICFISFTGLFVVIDGFANLEEFLDLSKDRGGLANTLLEYYLPQTWRMFDRTSALIALVASIFALSMMQKTNELTAIEAAGISKRRAARPIIAMAVVVVALSIANRELLIPSVRSKLTMNAQDLTGSNQRAVYDRLDYETGIGLQGKSAKPAERLVDAPVFLLPDALASESRSIRGTSARYLDAEGDRPAGYHVDGVRREPAIRHTLTLDGREIVLAPAEHRWLKPDELFVVSKVTVQQLAFGPELARFASIGEMIRSTRYPTSGSSNRPRVEIHGRLVKPVLDMTILLIGLPLVISRQERNLFLSAGICLLIVITMTLTTIVCHALGASRMINSPALAAWLPLILFVPVAAVTVRLLDR